MLAQTLGKYRIERTISSGSFGTVVQATDSVLKRTVALKILRSSGAPGVGFHKHLREARALARLRHPNIVTIFELDEIEGQTILAMEHVEGEALAERLKRQALPTSVALEMSWLLADAVAVAHRCGVVHADIKPANVILDRHTKPLLVDFGLASLASFGGNLDSLAATQAPGGGLCGTIGYMPPELFMGAAPDRRTDIFSFGALTFEMLSGHRAFEAETEAAILNRVLNGPPATLRTLRPDLPAGICELVDRMLAHNAADRPASMDEVRDTIGTFIGKEQEARPTKNALTWLRLGLDAALGLARSRTFATGLGAFALCALFLLAGDGQGIRRPGQSVQALIANGLDQVSHFEEKGAIDAAIGAFQTVLARAPQNAAATAGLSLALFRRYTEQHTDPAVFKQAAAAAALALSLDGQLALAHVAVAWSASYGGDKELAYQQFNTALMLDGTGLFALEGLARLYREDSRPEDAIALYRRGIELHPDYRVFYDQLGKIYFDRADYKDAEALFGASIERAPDSVYAYASLSAAQHMQGHTLDAIATVQKGLRVRPHPVLYNNLGTYLYFLGQYPQAAQAFERLMALDGNTHNFMMWGNLADAYRWTPGQEDKARTAYRVALQLVQARLQDNPTHPVRNSFAALYHAKLGEAAPALAALGVALAKPNPAILFQAAVIHEILGDRDLALEFLHQALQAGYAIEEIANEPELSRLRQDRRYQETLLAKEE